jgi:hypothetical protein
VAVHPRGLAGAPPAADSGARGARARGHSSLAALFSRHAKRFFEAVDRELEFLRFEPTNFLSGGSQVAVPINVEAKVKSTGRVVEALEIHLWTFDEDGKVSRFFHCIDRHAFVLAYGV